jgi:hypothetical protein
MQWLEEILQESAPTEPTPFDVFCQKKLKEFRDCAAKQISRSVPVKAKLQKLVDMIVYLQGPNCRGK